MSGGKGGSTSSSVSIPEYIEAAAQRNLNKAEKISQLGYVPYYGADVAAFTPMQEAAFQNTANTAGAYGMASPLSQQDIMGGMPAATTYANGVRGYSAAPLYEQSLQTLAEKRPGQKDYIDSFFIDPFTGAAGSNAQAPIDYTSYPTGPAAPVVPTDNSGGGGGIVGGGGGGTMPSSTISYDEMMNLGDIVAPGSGYDPSTDILTQAQIDYVNDPANTAARIAQEDLNMSVIGNANNNFMDSIRGLNNDEPSFADPSSSGSYGGSLVTGSLSGDLTGIPGTYGNIADNIYSSVSPEAAMASQGENFASSMGSVKKDDGSYDISSWYNDSSPTSSPFSNPDFKALEANNWQPTPAPTPKPYSVESNAAIIAEQARRESQRESDNEKSSSNSVLCTAYASMGYLPADIWSLDTRYGIKRFRQHPVMVSGYRLWASPIAQFIKTDTLAAKTVRAVLWPVVRAWAEEMAHTMKPEKYSGNKLGKLIMAMGEPFSYAVGATFLKRNAQKEL